MRCTARRQPATVSVALLVLGYSLITTTGGLNSCRAKMRRSSVGIITGVGSFWDWPRRRQQKSRQGGWRPPAYLLVDRQTTRVAPSAHMVAQLKQKEWAAEAPIMLSLSATSISLVKPVAQC